MINNEVTRHIKTHTERSSEDQAAVHFLENHLKSDGRINLDFAAVDKWPNTDGRFNLCPIRIFQGDRSRILLFRSKEHIITKNGMEKWSIN